MKFHQRGLFALLAIFILWLCLSVFKVNNMEPRAQLYYVTYIYSFPCQNSGCFITNLSQVHIDIEIVGNDEQHKKIHNSGISPQESSNNRKVLTILLHEYY